MPGSEPGHAPQRSLKTCGAIGLLLLPVRAPEAQLELHVGCELDSAQSATRRGGNNLAARALWNDARRGENGADRRVRAAAQLTRILRVARRSLITLDGRVIARVISRQEVSYRALWFLPRKRNPLSRHPELSGVGGAAHTLKKSYSIGGG